MVTTPTPEKSKKSQTPETLSELPIPSDRLGRTPNLVVQPAADAVPLYEDVDAMGKNLELKKNVAYQSFKSSGLENRKFNNY